MRIGEILTGSSLISKEQLDEALNYAKFKQVPVGRALRVLRYLSEDDLSRAIDAQKAIRKGLDSGIALDILKNSRTQGKTFNFTLENSALTIGVIPRVLIEAIIDKKLPRTLQQQLDALQAKAGLTRGKPGAMPTPTAVNMPHSYPVGSLGGGAPASPKATAAPTAPPVSAPAQPAMQLPVSVPSADAARPVPPKVQPLPISGPLSGQYAPGAMQNFQDELEKADKQFAANEISAAEKSYKKALEFAEQGYKPTNIAAALTKLANFYLSTDRLDDAAPLYERALQISQKVFGPGSPKVTRAQEDLAELYFMQNKLDAARKIAEEAIKNIRHEDTLDVDTAGRLLKRLMSISWRSGEAPPRARLGELAVDAFLITREQMQQALSLSKQTGAPLGTVLRNNGLLDDKQVESLIYAQVLMKESTVPWTVAVHALRLAVAHKMPLRKFCDAAKFITEKQRQSDGYGKLIAEQDKLLAAESRFGSDHPEVAKSAEQLGDLHRERKDVAAAEMLYKRAAGILERYTSADKGALALLYEKLALLYIDSKRYAEAQPLLFRSLELRKTAGTAESEAAATALWQLAQIELAQFNPGTALSFLRSARSLFEKLAPGSTPSKLLEQITSCCLETGALADLEPVLEQLIARARQEGRSNSSEVADYMEWLGDIYYGAGRRDDAVAQYALSLDIHVQQGRQAKADILSKKLAQSA